MLRIAVIGVSCSGKTTLARRIAAANGVAYVELDAIYWQPNWAHLPIDEFRSAVEAAAEGDQWVIDGNYSRVRDLIWARATDVVWMNLPFLIVLWRAATRTGKRIITREELFAGNRETITKALFDRESILWWVIRTYHRRQRTYSELLSGGNHLPFTVHVIRNSEDQSKVLQSFADAG